MACGSPDCRKAERTKKAIEDAKRHAKIYAKENGLDKMSIVEVVNGSISWTTTDDDRIGNKYKEIDVLIL